MSILLILHIISMLASIASVSAVAAFALVSKHSTALVYLSAVSTTTGIATGTLLLVSHPLDERCVILLGYVVIALGVHAYARHTSKSTALN